VANVDSAAIQKAMKLCQQSISELQNASKGIESKYQQAGSSWRDSKYQQLGGIIGECVSALRSPVSQLSECMNVLSQIAAAISEYEGVSF